MENTIKSLRAQHHLTQEELAQKIGVRRETIVFLEKGKYNPSLRLALQLARIFHVTVEEIFSLEEND